MRNCSVLRADFVNFCRFWAKLGPLTNEPACPPPLPEGRVVNVPGRGEMLVRELGGPSDGPTILLLHGWTLSADLNWFSAYDALAAHGRVLAIDQRGHGRGLRSEEPFTLAAAADDAAALLRHLGAVPAIVVGYSMGGSVALLQWQRHPDTVAGLVLQSTGLQWRSSLRERVLWLGMTTVEHGLRFGTPPGLTARYLRLATGQNPALRPYLPWLKAEVRRSDPTAVAAAGRDLSMFDARPFAGDIDVPTTVVVARHDRLIVPNRQRRLADAIPCAQVVDLDAGHNAWMVRPEQVARALTTSVASVTARIDPGPSERGAGARAAL
ncbi:MAG: alpha/beta fold hydrolase [Acidimicrobiales bacterium]